MSKITTLYDAMVTQAGTTLSGHLRLGNAYKPDENPDLRLKKGWGLTIGPAVNSNRLLTGHISIQRRMNVVITRQYMAIDDDAANKAVTEKLLCEDMLSLIEALNENRTLGGVVMDTRYISDDGIEYVSTTTDRFLMIRTEFEVEYFEPINC